MVRGFYCLGSGMLTQSRVLDAVSNNMANLNTPGFKKERVTQTSFGALLINRMGDSPAPIGGVSVISLPDESTATFSEGTLENTGRVTDFAIEGNGFFGLQTANGPVYTRNGSFRLDQDGYLALGNQGRVLGPNGPIYLGTDDFTADDEGNLYIGGFYADRLAVFDFDDYLGVRPSGDGIYTGAGAAMADRSQIAWKTIEGSNVDAAGQMAEAMAAQRSLQSCSQALKMYDQVLSKAASEIARI